MAKQRPTVLVVDDIPTNIELLSGILHEAYQVKAAINGDRALKLARAETPPDLILLDVMMPGMSGYEVCKQLKADPATRQIPVIFVTAKTEMNDELQGLALGAVDYITKPFNPVIVEARVRTQLALATQQRELQSQNRALKERLAGGFLTYSEAELKGMVASGEGVQLEFKSTLRWNLATDKADRKIENQCLKTIAAFLNSDGGVLLVGVDDEGRALGLARDQFATEDKLLLHWNNLLKAHLGVEFMHLVRSAVQDIDGQRALVVQSLRSTRPVFFRRENEESYFVRTGNGTQALKPSEVLAYIEQRLPRAERTT